MIRRLIAISAGLLLFAGACGSEEASEAQKALERAAVTTQEAGTARVDMDGSFAFAGASTPPGTSDIEMHMDGVMDLSGELGHFTMTFSGLPQGLETNLGDLEFEMIIDGETLYIRAPFLASALPGDEPWLKQDVSEVAGSQFTQQTDPTQTLAYLQGVSEDVEEVGTDEIRGVETTHYRGTINLEDALEEAPEDQREQVEAMLELVDIETFPMNVWIDNEGRLRRFDMELDAASKEEDLGVKLSMTMDLYDFGVEVDVEPPPANQVQDAPPGLFPGAQS